MAGVYDGYRTFSLTGGGGIQSSPLELRHSTECTAVEAQVIFS